MKTIVLFIIFSALLIGSMETYAINPPSEQTEQAVAEDSGVSHEPFRHWQTYGTIIALIIFSFLFSFDPWRDAFYGSGLGKLMLWIELLVFTIISVFFAWAVFKSFAVFLCLMLAIVIGMGSLGQYVGRRLADAKRPKIKIR